MSLDYTTLELLRKNHPAWRLLCANHAPLVTSFLNRVFLHSNTRSLSQGELVEALEDELYNLRELRGKTAFPGSAIAYLDEWAAEEKGWLRKFYPQGSDEPHFDLTPASERALGWLRGLVARAFVGTESRLLTLFDLLQQISVGSQQDPELRIAELERERTAIDTEIARIRAGEVRVLDETAIKDRFQQFLQLAHELLSDFREVEYNFRGLDRSVRERIALWAGSKGELLEEIMGERDAITDSDQGRSFRAFWDFLMSQTRQEAFTALLAEVLSLDAVQSMQPDARVQRIHYDWLEAGEHTQRTVALLSEQLRRFLDDRAWLENRRIMDILRSVEAHALAVREEQPQGSFMTLELPGAAIELPLERPLYKPPFKPAIKVEKLEQGSESVDLSLLYALQMVDRRELSQNIRSLLQQHSQVTLTQVITEYPLQQGLAELLTYMQLAAEWHDMVVDEEHEDEVSWKMESGMVRKARLPRIILLRKL